ncbi:MAG: ABC transporter ATP-binding protein [Lachnospiraceae bacterium]|nr:ABC transporter ATP-binding protein [Candidatus Colinaster scatohippi]
MIEIKNLRKDFDDFQAVKDITANIEEGNVFGMVGTNGAGKSTLLRMIAGVLKPTSGEILVDGKNVYDNPEAKGDIFYISDEQFYFQGATPDDMRKFYKGMYPQFDDNRFNDFLGKFGLSPSRKINTFSKGMKKQLSVILGVCAGTKYLLCDETFDGLDPVMRQAVKKIFIAELEDRKLTPIIASHNLRELEDICDHVGLLHQGGILFSKDLDEMKMGIHRLQCVFVSEEDRDKLLEKVTVMNDDVRGSLHTITVRGTMEAVEEALNEVNTVFAEILPLSLEEIFISETEVVGYDVKNIID